MEDCNDLTEKKGFLPTIGDTIVGIVFKERGKSIKIDQLTDLVGDFKLNKINQMIMLFIMMLIK
jgi:hypothetical protein